MRFDSDLAVRRCVAASIAHSVPKYLCIPKTPHQSSCLQAADSFLTNAAVQTCLMNNLDSNLQSCKLMLFEGRVPSDLEAIFCRGSEWDSGAEHIFIFKVNTAIHLPLHVSISVAQKFVHLSKTSRVMAARVCMYVQANPQATSKEVDQNLSALAALAESSLAGALQTTHGRILCAPFALHVQRHAYCHRLKVPL